MKLLGRSKTYQQLRALMTFLPPQRLRQLRWLVPVSIIPGLLDLISVAVIARLMGALVGHKLEDRLPGIKVFGGNQFDQSLWLISLFVVLAWLASFSKLGLQFFQQRLLRE